MGMQGTAPNKVQYIKGKAKQAVHNGRASSDAIARLVAAVDEAVPGGPERGRVTARSR